MPTITKRGKSWLAQVRLTGHKPVAKSFPTKTLAMEWASKTERDMQAGEYRDGRNLNSITVGDLIARYRQEVGEVRAFGKNKAAVLTMLMEKLGHTPIGAVNAETINKFVDERRRAGAGGVTIGIDLTYLGGVLKIARTMWKIPVDRDAITEARARLQYIGVSMKSKERSRRPTENELKRLCDYFDNKPRQKVPMSAIIGFAVASAMRAGEICRLRWEDLNEQKKTIVIRDRKHPTEKEGNDQVVPLLGEAFDIVMAQPRTDELIFPVKEHTISTIFPRACQALGIEDLRFHDLRHEGVSRLFEKGYSIEQVALVSGHRDWKMLQRYTQLKAEDLHRELA
jgi:integrase